MSNPLVFHSNGIALGVPKEKKIREDTPTSSILWIIGYMKEDKTRFLFQKIDLILVLWGLNDKDWMVTLIYCDLLFLTAKRGSSKLSKRCKRYFSFAAILNVLCLITRCWTWKSLTFINDEQSLTFLDSGNQPSCTFQTDLINNNATHDDSAI